LGILILSKGKKKRNVERKKIRRKEKERKNKKQKTKENKKETYLRGKRGNHQTTSPLQTFGREDFWSPSPPVSLLPTVLSASRVSRSPVLRRPRWHLGHHFCRIPPLPCHPC